MIDELMIIVSLLFFSIHLCVTYLHTVEGVAKRFVDDVREIVAEIRQNPQAITAGSVGLVSLSLSFFLFKYNTILAFVLLGGDLRNVPEYS